MWRTRPRMVASTSRIGDRPCGLRSAPNGSIALPEDLGRCVDLEPSRAGGVGRGRTSTHTAQAGRMARAGAGMTRRGTAVGPCPGGEEGQSPPASIQAVGWNSAGKTRAERPAASPGRRSGGPGRSATRGSRRAVARSRLSGPRRCALRCSHSRIVSKPCAHGPARSASCRSARSRTRLRELARDSPESLARGPPRSLAW